MSKSLQGLIVLLMLLCWLCGTLFVNNIKLQKDNRRQAGNVIALTGELKTKTDSRGREVSEIAALQMSVNEIKTNFPALIQQIKEIGAKAGRINNISEIHTSTEKHIFTSLHDSAVIRYRDTTAAKAFTYKDKFYNITGLILPDSAQLNIKSTDTLIQVVYLGQRVKRWLWIFGRRQLTQTIRTANPANHVLYQRFIEIKK
jgi:hypothetical protein